MTRRWFAGFSQPPAIELVAEPCAALRGVVPGLVVVLLAAASGLLRGDDAPKVDPATIEVETDLPELLMAHNRERAEAGKGALEFDPLLARAAAVQSRDMAAHGKMAHEGSDGSTPAERVQRVGYKFQSTGENVAMGYRDVETLMKGWMDSPKHRENILGHFTQIGLARAVAPDGTPYWTAEFGRPWPSLDPDTAASDLVAAVNQLRSKEDKPRLEPSDALHKAAARHARANADRSELSRQDPDGKTPLDRLTESTQRYRMLGQADASGVGRPEDVMTMWLDSDGQKEQLLGTFTDAGAGYAVDETGKPYWTLILGRRR